MRATTASTTMAPTCGTHPSRRRRTTGFTLIELMITVAIVALLAAIAIPSYQDSVWKGKRAEAKAAIFKALQAEERYYTQNNTYVAYTSPTPPAGSGAFPVYSADNATNSRYTISVAQAGSALCGSGGIVINDVTRCVVVTATVVGNPDPKCGASLAMDTVGNKSPSLSGPTALCWK